MNTNQLMSFLALADTQSYQKAALKLHYSRSTIMDHIRALEQELGCQLIFTEGRRLVLTGAGEQFLKHALSIMHIYQASLADAQGSSNNTSLRIITTETIGLYFLNIPLTRLFSSFPDIDLDVQYIKLQNMQEMLLNKEADIAFLFSGASWETIPASGLKCVRICSDESVFFTGAGSTLAVKEELSLYDIASSRFILTVKGGLYSSHLARIYKETGVRIIPKQYVDSGTLLKSIVRTNDCVSMISGRVIDNELKNGELIRLNVPVNPMTANVVAMYPSSGSTNPALKKLLRLSETYLE